MDYEKKYKEALERARQLCAYPTTKPFISDLQDLFPELAESEDERIRKEIIDLVRHSVNSMPADRFNERITWLEKQGAYGQREECLDCQFNYAGECKGSCAMKRGEQKSVIIIPKFRIGDEIKTSNEESLTITKIDEKGYWSKDLFICSFDDAAKWELIEHKSSWSEEDEKMIETIIANIKAICKEGYYVGDVNSNKLVYPEQLFNWLLSLKDRIKPKQEWSEEDEKMLNQIIKDYERGNESWLKGQCSLPFGNRITWLKSLKDKMQSKQEWSEEDEQYLLVCKNALAKYQTTDKWDAHIISHWLEDKLKSLRPQSQWKPTDEQIDILDMVLTNETMDDNIIRILQELREQLKKLKA